jgi:hypothetical protein
MPIGNPIGDCRVRPSIDDLIADLRLNWAIADWAGEKPAPTTALNPDWQSNPSIAGPIVNRPVQSAIASRQ